MKYSPRFIAITSGLTLAVLLAGCGESGHQTADSQRANAPEKTTAPAEQTAVDPWFTDAQVRQGRAIYNDNCASCHGGMAQGAPNWRKRGPDGNFPAPPLNGSGHTWHHPQPMLERIVREGGAANMPAMGDKLSEAQIKAVLAYVQSLWPQEIYNRWAQSMQGGG